MITTPPDLTSYLRPTMPGLISSSLLRTDLSYDRGKGIETVLAPMCKLFALHQHLNLSPHCFLRPLHRSALHIEVPHASSLLLRQKFREESVKLSSSLKVAVIHNDQRLVSYSEQAYMVV